MNTVSVLLATQDCPFYRIMNVVGVVVKRYEVYLDTAGDVTRIKLMPIP